MTLKNHSLRSIHDAFADITWDQTHPEPIYNDDEDCITINYPVTYHKQLLQKKIAQALKTNKEIHLNTVISKHKPQSILQPLKKIKNIIAISASKGGVGKSTIASNLACALAKTGCKIGLLDGDLYGPNLPQLIGAQVKASIENEEYQPVMAHQIATMSMGFLIDEKTPLVWRGPMASAYFQNMVFKTNWPELDYLIIDLPPGTGDILLTMTQKIPISGVILVSTPQCLSIKDCQKGIAMLKKMEVPILGFIENMAGFKCKNCQHTTHIFPKNAVTKAMESDNIYKLGEIPLDSQLANEEGSQPLMIQNPHAQICKKIQQIAIKACAQLACRPIAKRNLF